MQARGEALNAKAAQQIDALIEFAADLDSADLRRRCPGREKLGDGTVGTLLAHTADNYMRIAALAAGETAHRPRDHGHADLPAAGGGDADALRGRLAAAEARLGQIAALDDHQLDSIPPSGAFRFCDGKRNLEEVLTALLTHQGHQVEDLASI